MKNLIFLLLISFLLSNCRTTKHTTESSSNTSQTVQATQTATAHVQVKTDNDKVTNTTTTITETEYFPIPEPSKENPEASGPAKDDPKPGSVKNTKVTVIENKEVDQGKTETVLDNQTDTKVNKLDKKTTKTFETVKTAPNTSWWKWFLAGIVVAIALIIYFRRAQFFTWIKKLFKI